ncbi:polyamine transporter RMV1 [Cocos nucifera]|uniref:Polyamine transporter RMV1 n=1 Tax=Cocos nucifera TaxID=13894 RepID=A0A8K0IN41_COCNU|nr:polyamine transporter RMV1 [Cocos nucifera]
MAASPENLLRRHAGEKAMMDREPSPENGGGGASRVEATLAFTVPSDGNEKSKSSVLEVEEEKLSNKENGRGSSIPVDESGHLNQQNTVDIAPTVNNMPKVSIVPLVFLIFYEVSGGPSGMEDGVRAAGPLLAILGFVIFPFLWSIPEALITAEMGTMFPENGGGVIDNALYPLLFLDHLKGLAMVGWVAVFLGVFSILPFIIMGLMAIPKLGPERWSVVDLHNVNWNLYLNTLFWNLNYWDSISTGAVPLDWELWTDGYFSDIAKILEWGMLPEFFSRRSQHGTPLIAILFSASGVLLLLSWLSFQEIIAAENILYCFGMLLEFLAFVRLRMKYPRAPRPYNWTCFAALFEAFEEEAVAEIFHKPGPS